MYNYNPLWATMKAKDFSTYKLIHIIPIIICICNR